MNLKHSFIWGLFVSSLLHLILLYPYSEELSITQKRSKEEDSTIINLDNFSFNNKENIKPKSNIERLDNKTNYLEYVRRLILNNQSRSAFAKRLKLVGDVLLAFSLNSNGTIYDIKVLSSSGHKSLDQSAVNSVNSTVGINPFPDGIHSTNLSLSLRIIYR